MSEELKVLDHGIVRLLNVYGTDQDILDAARISYSSNKGKSHTEAEDRGLIRYLLCNGHTSPFEMVEVKFYMRMPIFVARQAVRHRTANLNEISARYSELPTDFYLPEAFRGQSNSNKQMSEGLVDDQAAALAAYLNACTTAMEAYQRLLNLGVARELARGVLPVSTYTEWVWKIDLHNLMHFLRLRLHPHAQHEIQVYGQAMYDLLKPRLPLAFEAFGDYVLNARKLSAHDQIALANYTAKDPDYDKPEGMSNREFVAFEDWWQGLTGRVWSNDEEL